MNRRMRGIPNREMNSNLGRQKEPVACDDSLARFLPEGPDQASGQPPFVELERHTSSWLAVVTRRKLRLSKELAFVSPPSTSTTNSIGL